MSMYSRGIRRILVLSTGGVIYWLLFAFANNMLFYYSRSVFPLLKATDTPNPVFFIYTQSPIAFYNSGMEWFPTGHIMFMLLIGDTFFSVATTVLVIFNLERMYTIHVSGCREGDRGMFRLLSIFASLMILAPLSAIGVLLLSYFSNPYFLEVIVTDYTYVTNTVNCIVLAMLIPAWNKFRRAGYERKENSGAQRSVE